MQIHAITHNIFEFSDPKNFRRETYYGIVEAAKRIAEREHLAFRGATLADIATLYREKVPHSSVQVSNPDLDTTGREFNKS